MLRRISIGPRCFSTSLTIRPGASISDRSAASPRFGVWYFSVISLRTASSDWWVGPTNAIDAPA